MIPLNLGNHMERPYYVLEARFHGLNLLHAVQHLYLSSARFIILLIKLKCSRIVII